jgi:hypothetical protein
MADADPRFLALLETVTAFNLEHERHLISLGPDMIGLPEDLGLQNGPLLTPKMFETYIKPSYRRYIEPIKNAGMIVHMHSDGHILDLAEHFLDLGIDVLNVQDRVNGVGNLAELFGGRVAIDLDIDRQTVTVSGSPRDAAELVRSEVDTLRRPEGGLSLKYDWSPPTPLQNVEAVLNELERAGGDAAWGAEHRWSIHTPFVVGPQHDR